VIVFAAVRHLYACLVVNSIMFGVQLVEEGRSINGERHSLCREIKTTKPRIAGLEGSVAVVAAPA